MLRRPAIIVMVAVAAIVAGCASTPPRTKTVPLGVPPARDLVLNESDMPSDYKQTATSEGRMDRIGALDSASSNFVRNASNEDRGDVSSIVITFETAAYAEESFDLFVEDRDPETQVRRGAWGDESVIASSAHIDMLYLRNGTVVWITSVLHNGPRDVTMDDLAPRLLAKLSA